MAGGAPCGGVPAWWAHGRDREGARHVVPNADEGSGGERRSPPKATSTSTSIVLVLVLLVRSESGGAAASSAVPVAGRAVAAETAEAVVVALPFEKLKRLKLAGGGTLISP